MTTLQALVDPTKCVCHNTDIERVRIYSGLMNRGVSFPPIKVILKDGLYYVVDGNHRSRAAAIIGHLVLADIVDYEDASDTEISLIGRRWNV